MNSKLNDALPLVGTLATLPPHVKKVIEAYGAACARNARANTLASSAEHPVVMAERILELANKKLSTAYEDDEVLEFARALLTNTAQRKPRNFCADCGKRTPECSIHTCSPAWQVEQADKMKMKG